MTDFRKGLTSGRILLMDGGMGSELLRLGLKPGECFEAWNLRHPERVAAVHQSYVKAGAECILTNTFQANPQALARHGLAEELEEINHRAVELARAAADGFVLASVGPVDLSRGTHELDRTLRSLADADGLLLETWSGDFELAVQRALAPEVNPRGVPVLLSLTYTAAKGAPLIHTSEDACATGMTADEAARRGVALGVAALGVNCGRDIGLDALLRIVQAYRSWTSLPLLVRPNAGTPMELDGRWVYPRSAEEMAGWIPKLLAAGVTLIGGCCGTTPEHIARFHAEIEKI